MPALIEPGTLVLTKNSRLARWLLFQHNQRQIESGLKVWDTPEILPLDSWLRKAWQETWPDQFVLTELQSRKLWEQVIHEDRTRSPMDLLHLRGSAQMAAQASQLIRAYRLPLTESEFQWTEETAAFHRWWTTYQKILLRWGALDPSDLPDRVAEKISAGILAAPARLRVAGFDEISPQLQHWLEQLAAAGTNISSDPATEPEPLSPEESIRVVGCEDRTEECRQCARWVRSVYQAGQTIGVLVPELTEYRRDLVQELKAELAPASVHPWEGWDLPFNISLGRPLAQETFVRQALDLLSLERPVLPIKAFLLLIRSHFFPGLEQEHALRLELEDRLLRNNQIQVHLYRPPHKPQFPEDSPLLKIFKGIAQWTDSGDTLHPGEWGVRLSSLLHRLGWPTGNGALNSHQEQVLDSWTSCLEELSSLDAVTGPIPRLRAMDLLRDIVQNRIFQVKTREEPIQILSLGESCGMRFDQLWVMGLHADAWPPPPAPNPFIPFHLQREHALPKSSAERELEFAERLFQQRLHLAENIVLSFPRLERDSEMLPSPLLKIYRKDDTESHLPSHRVIDQFGDSPAIEIFEDCFSLPLSPEEFTDLGGGYTLIQNQADCPFRAFATHRLGARLQKIPEQDLDASARGNMAHKMLEYFWREVKTRDQLEQLHQSGQLEERLRQYALLALQKTVPELRPDSRFFLMELERVHGLVRQWLELELLRPPFEVVESEEDIILTLQGLNLRLQVDRVDRTPDGRLILIDYKTGNQPKTQPWYDDRIQDPQLPLYSLKFPADAICFAWVKKGNHKFIGAAASENLVPGADHIRYQSNPGFGSWEELQATWRSHLEALAGEFASGLCAVNPIDRKSTCRYCDLDPLCRKSEWLPAALDDDGPTGNGEEEE